MKRIVALMLSAGVAMSAVLAQTPQTPQKPQPEIAPEDVIRITTNLVQTDVVVTDKSDQIIPDLKLEDFELYDNGKKQDIKFLEFIGVDTGRRTEGTRPPLPIAKGVVPELQTSSGISAREVRRVVAFVIDDLTIPIQDIFTVRKLLLDFVDNRMRDGDLVAIVRVLGGKGLLQQFTSDRQLLRRAIALITPSTHALMNFNNPDLPRFSGIPTPIGAGGDNPMTPEADAADLGTSDISSASDEQNRLFRGLSTLTTAEFVIDSLKEIPGHKNLVIISGGIPIFEISNSGSVYSNVSYILNQLSDDAMRAGVVVNTLDPRGLRATPGVAGFEATPARSALDMNLDPAFGRGGTQSQAVFGGMLAGGSEHLGLSTVANATGGVSVVNTNNFEAGMEKILARSQGYYLLAYTPSEKFDRKWHKIEVKVRRSGAKIYSHSGYVAREEPPAAAPRTKEEEVAYAAKSPLAKRDIDVTPNVTIKLLPTNKAAIDVHMLIDARNLHFSHEASGKYQTSLDVVGFLFDQFGRRKGGLSETINLDLAPDTYQRTLAEGLPYSAALELPAGYYQIRCVVREPSSGSLGTFSKYVEIPDLTKGRIAMSSVFLFAVDSSPGARPAPLLASRRLTQKQELRFAAMVYNSKLKDGKPQVHSQVFITQGNKVLYSEPDQLIVSPSTSPVVKLGQVGLSKVPPGRYVLTVVVTDPLADKNNQTQARSIDFTVVN
jgi:VWFA-related protein